MRDQEQRGTYVFDIHLDACVDNVNINSISISRFSAVALINIAKVVQITAPEIRVSLANNSAMSLWWNG